MDKKYLAKIIATDNEGLQMISTCCAGAKVKISDIKFLQSNKIFLLSIERTKIESEQEVKKINSICKFDFIDHVKSKNIDKILFSLILGGAIGNFYDRLVYFAVPDFIDIHYNNFHWFTFNIADIFISIGIIMIVLKDFLFKKP